MYIRDCTYPRQLTKKKKVVRCFDKTNVQRYSQKTKPFSHRIQFQQQAAAAVTITIHWLTEAPSLQSVLLCNDVAHRQSTAVAMATLVAAASICGSISPLPISISIFVTQNIGDIDIDTDIPYCSALWPTLIFHYRPQSSQ